MTVSVTRVGACACTRACVSECIPTSLWAGHRAHCLQWGGDESCQPCSPVTGTVCPEPLLRVCPVLLPGGYMVYKR